MSASSYGQLPWEAVPNSKDKFYILDVGGRIICEAYENLARLIVTAVNAHAVLEDQNKQLGDALSKLGTSIETVRASNAELLAAVKEAKRAIDFIGPERAWTGSEIKCWRVLDAAIAKAEEDVP